MSKSDPPSSVQRSATRRKSMSGRRPAGYYRDTAESLGPDVNIGYLIKQLQSSFNRMMELHMAPLGLTAMQWRPLVLIRYRNVNTPAELSRHTNIDTGAMTRALDRLEAKHFISRQRCPDDRRSVRIELTKAGNEVAEQILPAVAATLNTHLRGFSKDEIELFIDMIARMLANGEETAK